MATFVPDFPIAGLVGADYNPRRIDEESRQALKASIERLGMCKPIIVSGNLIIAGHQRTTGLRALGIERCPAVVLGQVTKDDEIRFNQLHNGTDFDCGDEAADVGPAQGVAPRSYEMVPAGRFRGNLRGQMANVRGEIAKLMHTYGNWGGAVATMSGEVIHAAQYVLACVAMNFPARIYRIEDALRDEAKRLLGRGYGVFSYGHLERHSYIQTYAQPMRLRETTHVSGLNNPSNVYEKIALPAFAPGMRLLDFGCGQGDYVKRLRAAGRRVFGIEFFFRSGKSIDPRAVHRMIDEASADLARNGLFDIVLADSVINSVDSEQAEADVLNCINAFCKPGGLLIFAGRCLERVKAWDRTTKKLGPSRNIEFLDDRGFTAIFRNGHWFFQKYHSREQATLLGKRWIGPGARYSGDGNGWQCFGRKQVEVSDDAAAASIRREFDLMWPNGRSVGRSQQMLDAWVAARSRQPQTASSGTS